MIAFVEVEEMRGYLHSADVRRYSVIVPAVGIP
jgi:hypothetical protein